MGGVWPRRGGSTPGTAIEVSECQTEIDRVETGRTVGKERSSSSEFRDSLPNMPIRPIRPIRLTQVTPTCSVRALALLASTCGHRFSGELG
jgi:hypothetical protein